MKNIISFICGILIGIIIGGVTTYYTLGLIEKNKDFQPEGCNCSSPDYAQIKMQDTIIEGESTDFEITIMKDKGGMSFYTGTILITITNEDGMILKDSEYFITQHGLYTFTGSDLGSKRFEKGLTIYKEGTYYLKISHLNDYKDKILGIFPISVINNNTSTDKNNRNDNLAHTTEIKIFDSESNMSGEFDDIDFEDYEYSTNKTPVDSYNYILPDSIEIKVKDPIIIGEATNLKIKIIKDNKTLTNYNGTIIIFITEENGNKLKDNEYSISSHGIYKYLLSDLGDKNFQGGLQINKEGKFYIEVMDLNDNEDKILGKQLITVINPH